MKKEILNILIKVAEKYNTSNLENERIKESKADVVTKSDLEVGDFVVKNILEYNYKIIVESEEHGKQKNFTEGIEDYYVAIDDIDGTNNLRVGKGMLPFCTMIVVFKKNLENLEYRYKDFICAACLEYVNGKIFYTEKGLGEVLVYDTNGTKLYSSKDNIQDNSGLVQTLSTDIVSSKRGGANGYAKSETKGNGSSNLLDKIYESYAIVDSGCSVFEYAMVGSGIRNGYISSGKKEHELPLLYAFCSETGKNMVDLDGISYTDKVYNFNGKDAFVIAGNDELVENCLKLIKSY